MITTHYARIEIGTSRDGDRAWADISRLCSGYVAMVTFRPDFGGGFFLAHRASNPNERALIIAPTLQWAGDIAGEGWIIDQIIEQPAKPAQPTGDASEG